MPAPRPAPTRAPDVAVIGAGAVGLSTAYALLERGLEVRVYETGLPGNAQSGGQARIFRHAHGDPRLVADTVTSRQTYDDWSRDLGVELVSPDGAVALGPQVHDQLPMLTEAGVDARLVDPEEVARLVPILGSYDGPAMLDPRGGSIRTRALVSALVEELGDRLTTDEVISVRHVGDEVEVRAGASTHRYRRVVVCAGQQSPRIARTLGASLPIEQAAHVRLTYAVRGAAPQQLATLQDSSGHFGASGIYAAALPGNTHFAVGNPDATPAQQDGTLLDPGQLDQFAEDATDYVRAALPGLDPEPVDVRHCWVTRLPWGEDGIGVWDLDGVLVPAGHNLFKQAPGLGRQLAAVVDGEELPDHLRPEARLGAVTA
ncbi:FAD-binding oxidoreductase [Nocardioidaceae bacterium]|nr:FAD-binding oxidoreductase [Nocardioidaceae bacterium]